jgi:hypothetical protein
MKTNTKKINVQLRSEQELPLIVINYWKNTNSKLEFFIVAGGKLNGLIKYYYFGLN